MANQLDTKHAFKAMRKVGLNPLENKDVGLFLDRWDQLSSLDPEQRINKAAQLALQDKLPELRQAELNRLTRDGQLPASARDYLQAGVFKPEAIKPPQGETRNIATETDPRELLKAGLGVSKIRYIQEK